MIVGQDVYVEGGDLIHILYANNNVGIINFYICMQRPCRRIERDMIYEDM